MVATNLKSEAIKLMDKRSSMEAEMNAIIDHLCHPGGPGLSGNLVDGEGFPRSDIDVHSVRAERQRLSELRNDYKDLTVKIDNAIQLLHSAKLAPIPSSFKVSGSASHTRDPRSTDVIQTSLPRDASTAMDVDNVNSLPFAMVDEIADASPAAEDGFQLGDQIVKFGSVESGDNLLPRLASESQINESRPIIVQVLRQGSLVNLTVTPRTWSGRGLLGCHFQML